MSSIIAIIEARMTSSRLPGKVMLPVVGKPMLYHLINRLKTVSLLDDIVLATTTNSSDDILEEFANKIGIGCFRGNENDVMSRVIGAASSVNADVVVEITGDCPIIDPQIVEQAIQIYKINDADYVSNAHIRSYPDGMDVQVFSLDTLKGSADMTNSPLDREHVTLHIRNNPNIFKHLHLFAPPEIYWPELGLTLDEVDDYELLKKIIEHFAQQYNLTYSCLDVVRFLRSRTDLVEINSSVTRKGNT
jgi:spore coat polysaccharide biosynthesis protein SpsF